MTDFPSEVGTRPELTRIGFTGTLWFVAAAVGVAGLFMIGGTASSLTVLLG